MASEAKHTPGPWRVEKLGSLDPWTDALSIMSTDEHGCTHWLASTTRGFEGAYLPNGEHDETSCAWANARLIAAAPDLLEALQKLNGFSEHLQNCSRQVGIPRCNCGLAEIDRLVADALAKAEGQTAPTAMKR